MIKKLYLKLLMSLMLVALAVPQVMAEPLIVAETTSTDVFVPLYGTWMDNAGTYSQTIYTPAQLSSMAGQKITSIAYHPSEPLSSNFNGCVLHVSLKEISQTGFSSTTPIDGMTAYGTCELSGGEDVVLFNLDEPFEYSGDNSLVVEVHVKTGAGYATIYWYAMTTPDSEYCSIYHYNTTTQRSYKIPMTTFTYEQGTIDSDASKLSGVTGNSYYFGAIAVGASKTLNLTLKNTGANAFTPSVTVTGTGFSTTYTAAELTNGQTATIPVVFNPTTAGDFNGNISVNCGAAGSYSIDLTGSAVLETTIADGTDYNEYLPVYGYNHNEYNQQNQMVYPASQLTSLIGKKLKSITFYPATVTSQSGYYTTTTSGINFKNGSATVSLATAEAGTITYSASGNTRQLESALTTVGTISIPSTAQTDLIEWTITFGEGGFVYNGGDLLVDVSTVKGSYGRTYFYGQTTTDYAGYSCTSSTAKTGQKFLPKVMFEYEDAVAQVTVTPTELTFGGESFVIGNTEDKTFKVSNTTDEDVILTLNDDSGFYSIDPTTIEAGATSVTVTVTYAPTTAGTHDATVTVGDKTVTLNGAAVAPNISGTVTPTELAFETYENVSTTQTITIENTGNTAFTPVFSALEAPFSIEDATEIAAGESKDFVVTYAPTAIGTNNSTLTVEINGTITNVALNGTATEAPLEITVAETGATAQSQPIPIEGTYFDTEGAYGQTIYNKDDLGALAGNNISKIKYYSATTFDAAKIGGTVLEIYLMETDYDEMPIPEGGYSCQPLTFEGAAVGEYIVQGGETDMEFVLSTPFNYSGNKNLAIQVRVKTKSPQSSGHNYQSIKWYVEGKTSNISYAGNVGYSNGGHALLPKTTFTYEKEDPHTITLAELCRSGVITDGENEYTIKDQLIGVYADDVKGILWCKDQGNASVFSTSINDGQVDFLKDDPQAQNGRDWDQSNWIALHFSTPTSTNNIGLLVNGAVNRYIKPGTVKGKLIDDVNYALRMDLDQLELVTQADDPDINPDYIPNVYCPANFMPDNLNIHGGIENGDGGYTGNPQINTQNYFFMNPKIQEICEVTYAQWDATHGCFTVPTASGFDGAFYIGTGYNVIQSQNFTSSLQDEHIYKFKAIVQRSDKDNYGPKNVTTPATGITLYPINLDPVNSGVPTAINTVETGNGEVKSVKYYNVAGIESDVPFQGVNIEVTTYTDGSRTSRKIMK